MHKALGKGPVTKLVINQLQYKGNYWQLASQKYNAKAQSVCVDA